MSESIIMLNLELLDKNLLQHSLVPCVLVTSVLPIWRMLNMDGALTSYQSFLEKGSTLAKKI